jgi:polar amino acid transport system permease protein
MTHLFEFWKEWFPVLADGFMLSLKVTAVSLLAGIPLGMFLALTVQAKSRLVRYAALFVVEIGRGTPLLILLQFVYFGMPSVGVTFTSFVATVIAFTCNAGAYTSEIIRAGFDAVPHGQKEAAASIGLTSWDALRFIVIPQGLQVALPALLGFSVLMLQGTSLCFTISLPEIVSQASSIGSDTFEYMPILILAALFFVSVCVPASFLVSFLERRLSRHTA